MKILAFDSSGLVASVAIVQDDNLIAEYTIKRLIHRRFFLCLMKLSG